MNIAARSTLILFALSVNTLSCHDLGEVPPPPPRIIPGVSIDGIKLGFTRGQVELVAGMPPRIGWADGLYKGWRVYGYDQTIRRWPCLSVYFFATPETEWGPVDMVTVSNGYEGKTQEGLGLGSRRNAVLQILGLPTKMVLNDTLNAGWDDYYCIAKSHMTFRYAHDTVYAIGLGPLIPEPMFPMCD